jgi:hypothetical protein
MGFFFIDYKAASYYRALFAGLDSEDALTRLRVEDCPHCHDTGNFACFLHRNNNGIGIECRSCRREHPFGTYWLKRGRNRRPPKPSAGARYCYYCGRDDGELKRAGIGLHLHHTKPFADHGDGYPTIPLCRDCHEQQQRKWRQYR